MARNKSLKAGLAQSAAALRTKEEDGHAAAQNFIDASARAQAEALLAAKHAYAVEQAVAILDEAGVPL